MKSFLYLILIVSLSFAQKKHIDIDSILKSLYQQNVEISKKSDIISKKEQKSIQKMAKAKLPYKLLRYYTIEYGSKKDIAIILSLRVRTKKTAVLYLIKDGKISDIEILAFSEPPEYKPKKRWLDSFKGKSIDDKVSLGDDITINSGATLSDRAVTKGARLALAIYKVKFENK